MTLFKTVLGILIIAVLLFSPLYASEKSGTNVAMYNASDELLLFDFVRFDHGIPGYENVPVTQYGGGINSKETLTSKNREPGKYALRIFKYKRYDGDTEFDFGKTLFIVKGVKEINIKLDPDSDNPVKLECDCSIKKIDPKDYKYEVYEFTPN
jgi:hypothetical protein